MEDATITRMSADGRFRAVYNACLQLATIALYASGHRTTGPNHHWVTFQVLPEIMGEGAKSRTDYLDLCRAKQHKIQYDSAGTVSNSDVDDLLEEVRLFRADLIDWLEINHSEFI